MDADQLRAVINNPAASPAQKEAARKALVALGETPVLRLSGGSPADPDMESDLSWYGPEVTALVDFTGVKHLRDVTVDAATAYVDAQPKPLSKSTLRVLSCFSASGLWPQFKATFPESEWRAKFTKFVVEHPYLVQDLAYYDAEPRRLFSFWATMCEHRDAYDVRVYLIQHVHEILSYLKEFQFELRDEIQAWITNQEKRWSPQEPWMWTDEMNISHPGPRPKQGRA